MSTVSPTMYPAKTQTSPQHVVGNIIAAIGGSTMGPFISKRGTGPNAAGMVAWLTTGEGQGRRILVQPTDGNGQPRFGQALAATVSIDTLMVVVRPMRGNAPGFVVSWTELTDKGKALWAVALGDDGKARSKPIEVTRSEDDITWIDVVPTDRGAVILWAEENRANEANLIAAGLDTDGRVREVGARVAHGVVGWSTIPIGGGIGLSTVSSGPLNKGGGPLAFQKLDGDGHPMGAPIVITAAPVVSGDVDVVEDKGRLLFAWTDHGTEEPAVALAALDENALTVDGPRRVAEARGGADLLGFAAGPMGAALMFEAPARRKDDNRHVHVAKVGDHLFLERPPFTVDTVGKARPEIAATATGFTVMATALDCEPDSPSCADAKSTATMWRTDAKMALVQREPLNFLTDPASMAWGLACEDESCIALAASGSAPARIRVAYVKPRVNAKAAALPTDEQPITAAPIARIDDVEAVATNESVVHLATAKLTDGTTMLTSLSQKAKESAAFITTRIIDDQGNASKAEVVAPSALPAGGVAVAFGEKPEQGGAMVWVGRDNGSPQVHITRIDKRGRKQDDSLLTTKPGDKTDVTITWAGNGYIVAWVDARDGNGEVYATKLKEDLTRLSREERITNAPGDASDLAAIARGDNVFLAWADARESPTDGIADIYVTEVKKHDAKRVYDEQRLLASAAHSRTPRLADSPTGVNVAWIEEAPAGSESNGGSFGAFWARVDDTGRAVVKPARMPTAGRGPATAVVLEAGAMHAVIARSMSDAIALDAVDLSAQPAKSAALLALDGPPSLDVSLVFDRGVLFFNDDGPQPADRRARRAKVAWLP